MRNFPSLCKDLFSDTSPAAPLLQDADAAAEAVAPDGSGSNGVGVEPLIYRAVSIPAGRSFRLMQEYPIAGEGGRGGLMQVGGGRRRRRKVRVRGETKRTLSSPFP